MTQKVLKIDDLNPDGLRITVDWGAMDIGYSVFIPCVNTEKAKDQIKNVAKMKYWTVETRVVEENGKLGLRTWRTV
tara:strand:+ start:5637 stop:5864 length:228 start_codon:yes stop_codon:yes gene_type:complete